MIRTDLKSYAAARFPYDTALCALVWALLAAAVGYDVIAAIGARI